MTVPYGHTGKKNQHSTSILCKPLLTDFFLYCFDIMVAFLHVPWVQKNKINWIMKLYLRICHLF